MAEEQKRFRACFFSKTPEAFSGIKKIKEDYEDVTIDSFPVRTSREGLVSITVVHYGTPKHSDLFSDEEMEQIFGGTQR